MRKRLKLLFTFLVITLLTGCSGNYNLIINKDMSVKEELEVTIDNSENKYNKTLNIFEKNGINKENYDVTIVGNKIVIKYNEEFDSIEDYILNSKVYHQLFDSIEYNKSDDYIDLYTKQELKLKNDYTLVNGSNLQDLDVLQINITNPYKVTLTNAEIENNNIYTWTIKNTDEVRKIQMQFKPILNEFPLRSVIVISVIVLVSLILIINILLKTRKAQRV